MVNVVAVDRQSRVGFISRFTSDDSRKGD